MDLIGPSEQCAYGHHILFVPVDYAMRYLEAVPLCNISACSVVEALFKVISQIRIPKEILINQGTMFMSCILHDQCLPFTKGWPGQVI